ncbi:MAG TPA: hypothetical protein PKC89_08090 [Pyrinomonadaceae bacterium]|nr:hypothetical protein [Pyrinomonadaceae bacterium]
MKFPPLICAFLSLVFLGQGTMCFGFETDQYDLPPLPLADIGDEVSDHALKELFDVVARMNAEIAARRACIDGTQIEGKHCDGLDEDKKRLEYLMSNDAVARELYKKLGDGTFPLTKIGWWINTHEFHDQPARYKTSYENSIFVLLPTNYLTISPTIRMYGVEFGVDKIEHFFQQGYTYYKISEKAAESGISPANADKKAIKWGKTSERTFYGSLVSGVFSNADLYANYAGMRFYQGLTKPLKIGDRTRPPVLTFQGGAWVFTDIGEIRKIFIRPFISEHLNEALNPSIFSFFLRLSIRHVVKKRACAQWTKEFPTLTKTDLAATSARLEQWNGEDYGFTESRKFITIANACFAE